MTSTRATHFFVLGQQFGQFTLPNYTASYSSKLKIA